MIHTFTKYLIAMLAGVAACAGLWIGLFYLQLGMPTAVTAWSHDSYVQKRAAAERFKGRRILVYGGSSGRFGISAEKMTKELHIPTINMATHAALGLDYFLFQARQQARPGDTVILALEYPYYQTARKNKYNASYAEYIVSRDVPFFLSLPILDQLSIIFSTSLNKLVVPFKEKIAPRPITGNPLLMYNSVHVNAYGDSLDNNRVFKTEQMRDALDEFPPVSIFPLEKSISNKLIQEFADWCRENQVTLIGTFPPLLDAERYHHHAVFNRLEGIKDVYLKNGAKFAGEPYETMYPKLYFFDYGYHLNDLGADLGTEKLISSLRTMIQPDPQDTAGADRADLINPLNELVENFNGWEPMDGMFQFTGPYPEEHLPIVIYGKSKITLKAIALENGIYQLRASLRPRFNGQTLSVEVGGQVILRQKFDSRANFYTIDPTFHLTKGAHDIHLSLDTGVSPTKDPDDIAVLFKSLIIQ